MEFKRDYLLTDLPIENDYDGPVELANNIAAMRSVVGGSLDSRCEAFALKRNGSDASLRVTLNKMAGDARWLIELTLRFRPWGARRQPTFDGTLRPPTQLQVTLVMSPTRLVAHARVRGIDMATADWQVILTSDESTYQTLADESASLRHDNFLPGNFLNPVARDAGEEEETVVERGIADVTHSLRAVEALIEHLAGCCVADRRWLSEQRPWVISQVETYWEFGQVDAIETVRRLRPTLWTLCKDGGERVWSFGDGTELLSFTARLTDAVGIAIYPKTVDRIRVEIRHRKDVPGNAQASIPQRLQLIATNAAGRADRALVAILEAYGLRQSESLTPDALIGLLSELAVHLQNHYPAQPELASDILAHLLTRGGLWCQGDETRFQVADALALKRLGIVEPLRIAGQSMRAPFFPLALRYRPLFEMFSPICQPTVDEGLLSS